MNIGVYEHSLAKRFCAESNRIENILREPTNEEVEEFIRFVQLPRVTVDDLKQFVKVYQPDAVLRDNASIPGVRVGEHVAPPSGPGIRADLETILEAASQCDVHGLRFGADNAPFNIHCRYETLHPFTDGNGRSGRALWAQQLVSLRGWGQLNLGFLHLFYYQSLAGYRR